MAKYDYKCCSCFFEKEVSHGMSETPSIFCDCGKKMSKSIPKKLNFTLKGDSWAGKNIKERSYRDRRRQDMGKKMAQNHDIPQIQPNYKGEVCKNWDEAKNLAKKDGLDPVRYEQQVDHLKKSEQNLQTKKEKLIRGEG